VFGSIECDRACTDTGDGPTVNVRSLGGFGSVTILTQSEANRQNVDD